MSTLLSVARRIAGICVLFLLAGCVSSSQIQNAEQASSEKAVLKPRVDHMAYEATYGYYVDYIKYLSEDYLSLSDQASKYQNAVALALIGSAATATGGALYNSSLELIKGAGLAAGTTTALNSYFTPGEVSSALLTSVNQLNCIYREANNYRANLALTPNSDIENDVDAANILSQNILAVKTSLRIRLKRQTPNYQQLLNQLKDAIDISQNTRDAQKLLGKKTNVPTRAELLDTLRKNTAECLLISS